jgi:hypothetical protein
MTAMGPARRLLFSMILFCLAAGGRAGLAPAAGRAQGNPLASFAPALQYVVPGALCTLQVTVDDAVDSLSCMGLYIALDDTAAVEVVKAIEGRLFKTAGYPTFFYWDEVSPDSAIAEDCVLGYRTYFLAPGELVRFVFRAKAPGACTVGFTGLRLWDIDRRELAPVAGGPAQIVVRYPTGADGPAAPGGAFFNYPNPFNPATVLVIEVPGAGGPEASPVDAAIDIYDVSGARVRSLFRGLLFPGRREILWNGRDDEGRLSAAGIYLAVAETASGRLMKHKIVLIR